MKYASKFKADEKDRIQTKSSLIYYEFEERLDIFEKRLLILLLQFFIVLAF